MVAIIVVIAVFDVVVSIVAAVVAENKGRSRIGWYFACMLLTPPVILILLALPSLKSPEPQLVRILEAQDETSKVCPQCAESVKSAAKICRFCRYEFPVQTAQVQDEDTLPVAEVLPYVQPPVPPGFVEVERKQTLSQGQHVFHRIRGEGCVAGPGRNRYFVRVRYGALDRDVEEVALGLFIKG